jgi:hypothetical protein
VRHRGGHHCEPEVEARLEASRSSHSELGRLQPHTLAERLQDGFRMLDDKG